MNELPRGDGDTEGPLSEEIELLSTMIVIRRFEETVTELKVNGEIAGSVHLCTGQEAIPVGVCATLAAQDLVTSTYRGHGWAIAKGAPLDGLFAELMGREEGVNGGRGGSAFLSHASSGFFGENSIVGAGVPIAVGLAMAAQFDESSRVVVTSFGDGATNQGAVHEALNFGAVRRAPVVFVCENNQYSELTPIAEMVRSTSLADRAATYGMPAVEIDGNDVEEVGQTAAAAVDRARDGGGPSFIEAHTQRLVGHYIGDVQQYRPPGEVDQARLEEPIRRTTQSLRDKGTSEEEIQAVEVEASDRVARALEGARESRPADPADVKEHLYA